MRLRSAVVISTITIGAFVLAGCGLLPPAPTPTSTEEPTASATPTPTPTVTPIVLPADAVLGLSLRATSDTGAAVDILLVLLKPAPIGSDDAAPRAAAALALCEGELDESVLEAQSGFSFGELDATVTAVSGTPVWPADLPLHLLPGEGAGPTITAGGAAYQVERPSPDNEPGFYVPECQQDAFLGVPGTGAVYLGWGDDGTTLDDWLNTQYGATFDGFGEPVNPNQATLSDCTLIITDLGKSMGATDATFTESFSSTQCIVTGPSV